MNTLQMGEMKSGSTERSCTAQQLSNFLCGPSVSSQFWSSHDHKEHPGTFGYARIWDCWHFRSALLAWSSLWRDKLIPSTFLGQTVAKAMAAPGSLMELSWEKLKPTNTWRKWLLTAAAPLLFSRTRWLIMLPSENDAWESNPPLFCKFRFSPQATDWTQSRIIGCSWEKEGTGFHHSNEGT